MESEPVEGLGKCGPRDLSPECCLKQFPGEWERCTGSAGMAEAVQSSYSVGMRAVAASMAVTVAVAIPPRIGSAERRGTELATNLLSRIEEAILQCVRKADQEVNDYHFHGRSPSWEICQQLKVGEKTTWAAYLGLFKHEMSWPCLEKALDKLIPKHYHLHPRFRHDERTDQWEFLDGKTVKQIVSEQGWKGLKGTIEPDIILLDANGFIIQVYDLKFPCPETNDARWTRYAEGPWFSLTQGDLYYKALQVGPSLVSPRWGIEPWKPK